MMSGMRIGEAAEQAGVTTKTLRYYERIGLLPSAERTESGYRSYGPDALERVRFIRDAQATGLSLTEIQSVLELKSHGDRSCEHTRTLLHRHLDEIDAQITRLQTARSELAQLVERADHSDPADCVDEHRCQVMSARTTERHRS
jgi:DNA-binding transcriptional MerR regulator